MRVGLEILHAGKHRTLAVPQRPGVWAIGDCALIPDRKRGGFYPPTAQHAIREDRVLAHNIIAAIRGETKKAFSFSTIGQLAAIGRRTGVANILGVNFSGFIAWWLWRTIYLSKLPRFEKKLRVALDWTEDVLTIGKHRFRYVSTPQLPHGGDAGVLFEEMNATLLCSDLFAARTSMQLAHQYRNPLVLLAVGSQPLHGRRRRWHHRPSTSTSIRPRRPSVSDRLPCVF